MFPIFLSIKKTRLFAALFINFKSLVSPLSEVLSNGGRGGERGGEERGKEGMEERRTERIVENKNEPHKPGENNTWDR